MVEEHDDEDDLEELHERARALGLEVVADVHDDDSLAASLERIDPEIFLLSPRDAEDDEERLDKILDLLPDVPAGKLAIADLPAATREDVDRARASGRRRGARRHEEDRRPRRWRASGRYARCLPRCSASRPRCA